MTKKFRIAMLLTGTISCSKISAATCIISLLNKGLRRGQSWGKHVNISCKNDMRLLHFKDASVIVTVSRRQSLGGGHG